MRGLGVDSVLLATRWCCVVGFVQNEQRARTEIAQPIAQAGSVRFVDKQSVGDEEAGMGIPGVDTETALAPDPLDVVFIQNFELEAEPVGEFFLPLQQHGRRAFISFVCSLGLNGGFSHNESQERN